MVLAGCLNVRQAVRSFDRTIYLMIGAALAAAAALEATGGALYIAGAAVDTVRGYAPSVTMSVIFLVVGLVTNVLSNNATAVLFTPIAIGVADRLGVAPLPMVVAVILAASCAFATPIGYQTNMLVMGPGHYRFRDYMIGGGPLLILMWLVFSFVGLGIMVCEEEHRPTNSDIRMTQHPTQSPQFFLTAPSPCPYLTGSSSGRCSRTSSATRRRR